MSALDALRRVVRAGRNGVAPDAADLDTLEEVLTARRALKRPKAGRPRKPTFTLEQIETVMTVLEWMDTGLSQTRAVAKVGGQPFGEGRNETLRKDVVRYRKLARWFLEDEAASACDPGGPKPRAEDEFAP